MNKDSLSSPGLAPLVSVIMPVGGFDDYLPVQLSALQAQTIESPWELIISYNGTGANGRQKLGFELEQRPNLVAHIVDSSEKRSASHARNVGVKAAQSDLLAFCDGDDQAEPSWLENLVDGLENSSAVGGHLAEDRLAVPGQEHWRPPATPGSLPTFMGYPFLVSANMAIRRDAFEQAGGFDVDLIRGEDIAFSWALAENGVKLGYVSDAIMHYRHRKGLGQMVRQHYLYGRGFSQILARKGMPEGVGGSVGLKTLRPNGQRVDRKGAVYFLRRGSIAIGRIDGLLRERLSGSRFESG